MQALAKKYRLLFVLGHGCASHYRGVGGDLLHQAAGGLTSHPFLAQAVSKVCPGESADHIHEWVQGQNTKKSQVYTVELARDIVEAVAQIALEAGDVRQRRYPAGANGPWKVN